MNYRDLFEWGLPRLASLGEGKRDHPLPLENSHWEKDRPCNRVLRAHKSLQEYRSPNNLWREKTFIGRLVPPGICFVQGGRFAERMGEIKQIPGNRQHKEIEKKKSGPEGEVIHWYQSGVILQAC